MNPSTTRIPNDVEHSKLIALAMSIKDGQAGSEGLYNSQYENGCLLVEPVNGEPYVANLRHGYKCLYFFESQPGSGTDHLRQRLYAQKWYEQLLTKQREPYYLSVADVPAKLRLKDLPIFVGRYRITQGIKPFKDQTNPISGHQWSEPMGLANYCRVQGPDVIGQDRFGTVAAALEDVAFNEKYPFHPSQTGTDKPMAAQLERPRP